MPEEVPAPSGNSLADLIAMMEEGPVCPVCPPPPPRPQLQIRIAVPEVSWEPGTVVTLTARPGTLNQPGGGECWFLEGYAVNLFDVRSELPDPVIARPETNCVPAPEPTFALGLGLGLILLAIFTRRKRRAEAHL